ncbi:MAG: tryptophan 7-halogenase [Armatimonadota bacterium]|nr:tryptophan 7-halogenase [Armatimonadota bacterium]
MTASETDFDVVVLGAGPAACAAALSPASAGRRVALLSQDAVRRLPLGESLPPAAAPLLHALGMWKGFQAGPHLPCYGTQSAWGEDELQCVDFIRDPNGHGWHLDRPAFDALVLETARDAGAAVFSTNAPLAVARTGNGLWRVTAGHLSLTAPWLIDGTGRARWLSRQLGVRRLRSDSLVGYVAQARSPRPDPERTSLVESAPEGWWYTAALPGGARVVTYFTDAGTLMGRQAATVDGFRKLLTQTCHIRERLGGGEIINIPQATAAHTARAAHCVGDGWLAVGDAALSFDPLSSQGLFHALATGLEAGHTLNAALNGDANALPHYAAGMDAIFNAYQHHRAVYYAQEQRWPNSPFWQRRHPSASVPGHRIHPGEQPRHSFQDRRGQGRGAQ